MIRFLRKLFRCQPVLQEIMEHLSGNKSFIEMIIDRDYHVTLKYQTKNIKFDTIEKFMEWMQ